MSGVPSKSGAPSPSFDEAARRVPFLRALAVTDRQTLRSQAVVRRIAGRRTVWSLGTAADAFTFVVDGCVKLVRPCENGRELIIDVGTPGELLCASAPCAAARYCCTCTALDRDAIVVMLPRTGVLHLLGDSPAAATAFALEAAGRAMGFGRRVAELAGGRVAERIGGLLLRLGDQVGTPIAGGRIRIPLKLSRHDLAGLCGTTVETAIRTMTRLAREGTVRTTATGFIITDRGALEALAGGRPAR